MFPDKFRLHVTAKDCVLGCQTDEPSRNCAVARPAIRKFMKIDPTALVGVGFKSISVRTKSGLVVYEATDADRMMNFTSENDWGEVQEPTSFTFRRVNRASY